MNHTVRNLVLSPVRDPGGRSEIRTLDSLSPDDPGLWVPVVIIDCEISELFKKSLSKINIGFRKSF